MIVSPLRYPGGKGQLLRKFIDVISHNGLFGVTYKEPYAGGAGLAIKLLTQGYVDRICLNDIDEGITAFWRYALLEPERFCAEIEHAELSVHEWRKQKQIYSAASGEESFELAFAAYYLNRTSRSGIIEGAGPIGGYEQRGRWKIDARFNKKAQVDNIQLLSGFAHQISVSKLDAIDFISQCEADDLLYIDPPYFEKGQRLYRNFYEPKDHEHVATAIADGPAKTWVVSYDDCEEIRNIYSPRKPFDLTLQYSAAKARKGREVIFFSDELKCPPSWQH